ncbi:hypothetical protein [Flavobacterium subsaxonicum]|uniref:Uncharacterized protein n=1 Tax=Flavobacterium subsaxonicum WB 4.1-42 = DSM 21790 TaxID=1121898 RepID=A0A0A2N0B7_9FLAO|nr:hypothetical protein [Flavobacterium subsaxonicum]KGO93910.1 hypothetical protein Q766_05855 [Flavobacterium subsaxonicum WB 4.1-42 = DSM 21790]
MKQLFLALMLAFSLMATAQDCQYSVEDATPGEELKTTKDYLMYEKVFAGTSQFLFFSLSKSQGTPILNFQLLSKSKDFPQQYCLDAASKVYLQLNNGKIITLLSATEDQCAGLMYDNNEKNNIRVLTGMFLFTKGSLEELEKSQISFIRVKYATETVDYIIKKDLQSEAMGQKYEPETYFIKTLKCIK